MSGDCLLKYTLQRHRENRRYRTPTGRSHAAEFLEEGI